MKQILFLLMIVTSMAYGQVSNTTATNFTNSLEASRIFNLPALIGTPPIGIKPGGLSYNNIFQKLAVWNGISWNYYLTELNADNNYIKNNVTNIPENKKIYVLDSIKTDGVISVGSTGSLQSKLETGEYGTYMGTELIQASGEFYSRGALVFGIKKTTSTGDPLYSGLTMSTNSNNENVINMLPPNTGRLANDKDLLLKQNNVTLTTTGSGVATFNQTTGLLNIPTPIGISIDNIPVDGSNNAVSSNGTFDALFTKVNLNGGNTYTGSQTLNGAQSWLATAAGFRSSLQAASVRSIEIATGKYTGLTSNSLVFNKLTDESIQLNVLPPSNITTSINQIFQNKSGTIADLDDIPTQFNPIAGSNITLSGTYPNITFNSTGGGGAIDTSPTSGSPNAVSSGGVFSSLALKGDLTGNNNWFGSNSITGFLNVKGNDPLNGAAFQNIVRFSNLAGSKVLSIEPITIETGNSYGIVKYGRYTSAGNSTATAGVKVNSFQTEGSDIILDLPISGGTLARLEDLSDQLNNYDLDVVHKSGFENISGSKIFGNGLAVTSPPTNPNDVVRLTDLFNYVTTNTDQLIGNTKTFTGLVLADNGGAGFKVYNGGGSPISELNMSLDSPYKLGSISLNSYNTSTTAYQKQGISANKNAASGAYQSVLLPANGGGVLAKVTDISNYASSLTTEDATSVPYTKATLNSTYPSAPVRYKVVCYTIGTVYEKYDLTNWFSTNVTILP